MRAGGKRPPTLGAVEQAVMDFVWAHPDSTAEECRLGLDAAHPMKDSTVRTVLRRLEAKGLVRHATAGRAYTYRAATPRANLAARAVKSIMDRFCGGSAEALVLGLVDNAVLKPDQLERLARQIAEQRRRKP